MRHQIKILLIFLSFSLLTLGGCTSVAPLDGTLRPNNQAQAQDPEAEIAVNREQKNTQQPKRPKPADYPVAPFQDDWLYQLLVAEIAGYRRDFDTALQTYVEMAEVTADPGVAARATRLANYLKRNQLALKAAQIWSAAEPDSIEAHRHAADQLVRSGDLEAAIYHMEAVRELGGLANFDVFAYRAAGLDEQARRSLLIAIANLLERYPDDRQLLFSSAVLLEQSGEYADSLALLNRLLLDQNVLKDAQHKDNTGRKEQVQMIALKANVLKRLQRPLVAIDFLYQMIAASDATNRRLRLTLARFLFEAERLDEAQQQYEYLHELDPNDADILFALALIALELGEDVVAKAHLQQLVRWDQRAGEAHYYLGILAEKSAEVAAAITQYRQVGQGYEFLPAQSRIANLMLSQGRLPELQRYLANMRADNPSRADQLVMLEVQLLTDQGMIAEMFELLAGVLAQNPNNLELLYFRAMTAQQFDRLDIMERDLQKVIEIDPANGDAMNALGYTLADQTNRYDEAFDLIQRALVIKPDEAAFIDSMGWVLYRLNKLDQALEYLRRALALFVNDEVAAHLGEVLWAAGKTDEATEVWRKAIELKPDSEILKKVVERFTQ
ncbi:MAG: tetratricopeptide repeat protein [Pseudomonadales bacterium]|nr:tetratricopeptide repeat protein [Pseudomonadales bacterium]